MVVWINPVRMHGDNPNPGMGVRFIELALEERERLVALVRRLAYLADDTSGD
jgi:type IV pilus assembly protein PilZ